MYHLSSDWPPPIGSAVSGLCLFFIHVHLIEPVIADHRHWWLPLWATVGKLGSYQSHVQPLAPPLTAQTQCDKAQDNATQCTVPQIYLVICYSSYFWRYLQILAFFFFTNLFTTTCATVCFLWERFYDILHRQSLGHCVRFTGVGIAIWKLAAPLEHAYAITQFPSNTWWMFTDTLKGLPHPSLIKLKNEIMLQEEMFALEKDVAQECDICDSYRQ